MKLATAAMAGVALALAATPLLAAPNSIDTLAVYAGTWTIRTTHYKTAYSDAGTETATLKNDCWRSEGYYACDQIVDGTSRALIVYTYDAKADLYHSTVAPVTNGTPGSGTLLIAGNVWTFPWEQSDGQRTVKWRVVNTFVSRDRIESRTEYSLDGTHWAITARSTDDRVK